MKDLLFDLIKEKNKYKAEIEVIIEKYNEYVFVDMVICDILINQETSLKQKIFVIEESIKQILSALSAEEIKDIKSEYYKKTGTNN